MSGKWHRALMMVGSAIGMIGGIVVITDPSTLGVSAENWKIIGGWLSFLGGIAGGVITLIRANAVPGLTTGIGNEAPVSTTTTVSVKETTP